MLDSASGKLSLAYAEDDDREQILKWMSADQDIDPEYLAEAKGALNLDGVRERGYALQGRNYFNHTPGKTSSIAVPIFADGKFEAAMTLVFFVSAMKIENALQSYLPEMLATASAISAELSQ